VDNKVEGIVWAIEKARLEFRSLQRNIVELKRERARLSAAQVDKLRDLCEELERGGSAA